MGTVLEEDIQRVSRDPMLDKLAGTAVLVTGATGLIGSFIVRVLMDYNQRCGIKKKIQIYALIRNREKAERMFGGLCEDASLTFVINDLMDIPEIRGNIDYIIHTASVTTSKYFVTHPVETFEITYRGTQNILELARNRNVKSMVYLSSMEMYGKPDPDIIKVSEEDLGFIDILNVRSSYSEGKRAAECICAAYVDEYQVPVKIARLAQTFGSGVRKDDNRVYAQFARSVIAGEDIILHTEGKSNGNYCYITDAVRGIILLLQKGANGQAYNICNEETTTTIAEMAKMVADKFGNRNTKVFFDIPEDAKKYGYAPDVKMHLSSQKIQALGWRPEYDLQEMYRRLITYLQQEEVSDFDNCNLPKSKL